jgi:FkbM family methyltransferase
LLLELKRMLADYQAIALDRFSRKSYSQEGEDMILSRLFETEDTGFYVDVGAHHPMRFSNTHLFYRRGWRGMNIEPNPEAMRAFHVFRRRDINLEIGVNESAGALTYFCFDDPALNTFDAQLAESRQETTPYRVEKTMVIDVERLDAILSRHLPRGLRIDFMSIDVEGFDLPVLKSNDWTRFRPRCVLAEALGLSLDQALDCEVYRFMQQQDYELFAKSFNTLIFRDRDWKSTHP